MKLHTEIFIGAKFVNDMSTFFVDKLDQKFLLSQNYKNVYTNTPALVPFEEVLLLD